LNQLLKKGLSATAALFASVRPLYELVYRVAHVLGNQQQEEAEAVRKNFAQQLDLMREQAEQYEPLRAALLQFLKVTDSYAPHLFFCYQVADLPRTNNDLEQAFGKVRSGERRATGRRGAIPGLVVRGHVRLTAALATRLHLFTDEELVPHDLACWRELRAQVSSRQETRRKQFRFRKNPTAYLAHLEEHLSKMSLRS
jgi:hypothetical protein